MKPFNYMGILLGILMIFIGIVGCTYTYIIDHRSYDNLAQCCKASFNTAYAEDGHIEGANLTLIQYRYTGDKPNPITSIIIDGIDYPVEASVKQTMPTYDFSKPFSNNTLINYNRGDSKRTSDSPKCCKNGNRLSSVCLSIMIQCSMSCKKMSFIRNAISSS